MDDVKFKPGDVVMTPHGKGVILDIELVNHAASWNVPVYAWLGRYVVKLDEGHTWAIKTSNPCYWPKDLKHI